MKLTKDSSFPDLIKGWKRSGANMGAELSYKFLMSHDEPEFYKHFFKAERLLMEYHKEAFLAWLKLQQ